VGHSKVKEKAVLHLNRGFVALDGPTLADGIPLNLADWQREGQVRIPPRPAPRWRPFVAELGYVLRPPDRLDPRTSRLRWLFLQAA
jgi:hypothetical protein